MGVWLGEDKRTNKTNTHIWRLGYKDSLGYMWYYSISSLHFVSLFALDAKWRDQCAKFV